MLLGMGRRSAVCRLATCSSSRRPRSRRTTFPYARSFPSPSLSPSLSLSPSPPAPYGASRGGLRVPCVPALGQLGAPAPVVPVPPPSYEPPLSLWHLVL